ncbi:hypothetical protein [Chryseobacterium gallinarum]|uniref:DUF4397 domain-containing protein n=1 Tax=Chryseobacterium gallinarum TaxID=1324352 RepID=A0ABX6KU51_CHRGL|nr:hypothetical protein [Chryseobacterium gallinarum]QIY90954.1 hypothetical protein FOB44_09930 [Chryseobacterium gallinarum]
MKKIFLYILAGSLCFSACKKSDDDVNTYVEPEDINVQNSYDDQAIKKFMDENYLDVQGNIKSFSATDTADDKEKKLSQLDYKTLPSGTIYIIRDGAQPPTPTPPKDLTIKPNDSMRIMVRANSYLATLSDGKGAFTASATFINTINGNGVPVLDPTFYYISNVEGKKNPLIKNATTDAAKQPGYYVISGFNEALQKFNAYDNISNSTPYNLQGVIIVPSRAAFARNPHYPYNYAGYASPISLRNRSFVFNFQVYGREDRPY